MKRVSIFGSTGSIGQNTLDLIRRFPIDFEVIGLSGAHNIQQLAKDSVEFGAKVAVTAVPSKLDALKAELAGTGVEAAAGPDALLELADRDADWVMSAIVGAAGLEPGLRALKRGATLALANKESLVCAGQLLLQTARDAGATVLPVDSEHSAVFQALIGEDITRVERVIITASGGAFRDWPTEKLASATPAQAASHPNWAMGAKITIDSASLFNKALEVIETREYFEVRPDQIEVLIHPESLVHALVGFADGGLMAHVGPPDMRHAIGFALFHPDRQNLPVERLDLAKIGSLNFSHACEDRHPALRLAREVMAHRGLWGAAFNAAKEVAQDRFVAGEIGFMQMAPVVEGTLNKMSQAGDLCDARISLENVLAVDHLSRTVAAEMTSGT